MKQATALYKQLNFNVSSIRKLKKSIRHSLQLIDKLHFDPSLTDRSWIYLSSGKTRNLLDIPEEKRQEFADKLIDNLQAEIAGFMADSSAIKTQEERQVLTKTISKRRNDLNKEISGENYTEEQKIFVENLLTNGLKIDEELPENTDILDGTKAKKIASKLIELHNARIEKPKFDQKVFARSVVMQESFFKFPIHNKVELEDHYYHAILTGYYKKYFPEYDIKMAVFHGNEKLKGTPDYNNHCHVFLSTLNKQTQRYDFIDTEIRRANEFAAANGLEAIETKDIENMRVLGELRQKMFYEHAQAYLNEKQHNIELHFLPETEQRRATRKLIKKQANLPKEQRFYNQLNYQQEQISKQRAELLQLSEELEQAKQVIEQQKADNAKNKKLLSQKRQGLDLQEQKIYRAADKLRNKNQQQKAVEAEQQKEGIVLSGIQKFLQTLFKWANAVISNSKEDAKISKYELDNDLKRFEKTPFSDTLKTTLMEAELMAEATERRTNIEEMLRVSPNIKKTINKVIKIKV